MSRQKFINVTKRPSGFSKLWPSKHTQGKRLPSDQARHVSLSSTQRYLSVISMIIILASIIGMVRPEVIFGTGYAVRTFTEQGTDMINQTYNDTFEYTFTPSYDGNLKSVSISGEISGTGRLRAILITEAENYTIYDSGVEEDGGLTEVTANAPRELPEAAPIDLPPGLEDNRSSGNDTNETEPEVNDTVVPGSSTPEVNVTIEDNSTSQGDDPPEENDSIQVNETPEINQTNQSQDNQTINTTPQNQSSQDEPDQEEPIEIQLEYRSGTIWDENDDGIEPEDGVIDFTVEETSLSGGLDESHLCTKWGVYSEDESLLTQICYGESECCAFVGLSARDGFEWDDPLEVYIGRYGATSSNIVFAEVLYGYFDLDPENPVADFIFSEQENLSAQFVPAAPMREFQDECGEACLIDLNQSEYMILFEIENASVYLSNLSYAVEARQLRGQAREVQLRNALRKQIHFDEKLEKKFEENDNVRVIVKKTNGRALGGRALEGLSRYEVKEIDLFDLAALNEDEIESVYVDDTVSVLVNESMDIINANMSRLNLSLDGSGQTICFVDTGINYSHPDIDNYYDGYDFANDDYDPMDDHGHGTGVGGVLSLLAPGSDLVVAKVLNSSGEGYESDVLEGLQWCIDVGADIISFSIGSGSYSGYCDSNLVAELVNEAVAQGIVVFAATGNDGNTSMKAPSCASGAMRVSAVDKSDSIAGFANVNLMTDVFAPGENILTTSLIGGYQSEDGTSLSAPMAAAAAALVLENETLSPEQLKYRMRSTGQPISYIHDEVSINISRINVFNALTSNFTMQPYNYSANETDETDSGVYQTLFTGGSYYPNSSGVSGHHIDTNTNIDGTKPPFIPGHANYDDHTSGELNSASANDGTRNAWVADEPDSLSISYVNLWYNFSIADTESEVGEINITWDGYNNYAASNYEDDFIIYIWNDTASSWYTLHTNLTRQASDYQVELSLSSEEYNLSDFIDDNDDIQVGIIGDGKNEISGGLCFTADTPITMADGSHKAISSVRIGDSVKVFNPDTWEIENSSVIGLQIRPHDDVHEVYLANGKVIKPTQDHPFLVKNKGWATISGSNELGLVVEKMLVGDFVYVLNSSGELDEVMITKIEHIPAVFMTYNFVNMKYETYVADDIIVHNSPLCFEEGTEITMADGSKKSIEKVEVGDKIVSWDFNASSRVETEVSGIWSGWHEDLYTINGAINVTAEHPFWSLEQGWVAIDPNMTLESHGWKPGRLVTGMHLMHEDGGYVSVESIEEKAGSALTFNLNDVKGYHNFFAGEVLVHNKKCAYLFSQTDEGEHFEDVTLGVFEEPGNVNSEQITYRLFKENEGYAYLNLEKHTNRFRMVVPPHEIDYIDHVYLKVIDTLDPSLACMYTKGLINYSQLMKCRQEKKITILKLANSSEGFDLLRDEDDNHFVLDGETRYPHEVELTFEEIPKAPEGYNRVVQFAEKGYSEIFNGSLIYYDFAPFNQTKYLKWLMTNDNVYKLTKVLESLKMQHVLTNSSHSPLFQKFYDSLESPKQFFSGPANLKDNQAALMDSLALCSDYPQKNSHTFSGPIQNIKPTVTITHKNEGAKKIDWIRLKVTDTIDSSNELYGYSSGNGKDFVTKQAIYYLYPVSINIGNVERLQYPDDQFLEVKKDIRYVVEFERLPDLEPGYNRKIESISESPSDISINPFYDNVELSCLVQPKRHFTLYEDLLQLDIGPIPTSAPTHNNPAISPDPAYIDDNLTCTNQSTDDADGDNVTNTYNWLVDGTSILLLNLPFDSNVSNGGDGVIVDYSGFSNNGSSNSTAHPDWSDSGKIGGAYNFNTSQTFNVSRSSEISDLYNFTIDFWIKPNEDDKTYYIFSNYNGGVVSGKTFAYLNSGTFTWFLDNSGYSITAGGVTAGAWKHYALRTIAGSNMSVFVDGVHNASHATFSASGPFLNDGLDNYIFGMDYDGTDGLNGSLDNFRIWNRSLSDDQIYKLYEDSKDGYSNLSTIVSDETSANENWTCQVTPMDAADIGTTKSDSMVVQDRVSVCGTLTSNTVMLNNVTAQGTCYTIATNDVTLDCAGYTIEYDNNSVSNAFGVNISSGASGVTLKNCIIEEGSSGSADGGGVLVNGTSTNITNVTITTVGTIADGVKIIDDTNDVSYSYIFSAYGVRMLGSAATNNDIHHNDINASIYPIHVYEADHNTIRNNNIDGYNDYSVYINVSDNVTVHSNNVTGTGTQIVYYGTLSGGSVYDNYVNTTTPNDHGIFLYSASDLEIYNNTVNLSGGGDGLRMQEQSENNLAYDNRYYISDADSIGLYLLESAHNTFRDEYIEAVTYAIYITGALSSNATNNTFANLTINDSAQYAYYAVQNAHNNVLLNSSLNLSKILVFINNNNVSVQWHVRAYVENSSGAVAGASVNLSDINGTTSFDDSTAAGYTDWYDVTSHIYNGSHTLSFNNHTLTVTASGHINNVTYWNISNGQQLSVYLYPVNNPPTHSTPIISPDPAYTTSDLVCINQSTDDYENETVTNIFNWKVNGNSITVLNMPFDIEVTDTNAGSVKDYSGDNNNATLNDSETPTWTADGKVGGAFSFETSHISSESTFTPPTGSTTMCAWIYPLTSDLRGDILTWSNSKELEHNTHDRQLFMNTDRTIGFYILDGSDETATSTTSVSLSAWSFICGVINGTNNILVYINGTQEDSEPIDDTAYNSYTTPYFGIGKGKDASNNIRYFNGSIDQVLVYNITLSQEQIYQLYQDTKEGYSNASTIVNESTTLGDSWTCEVTPNDANSDGTKKTDSVTVENKPPEMETSRISPASSASDSQNLIGYCNASDADGDNVTYYYQWYVDGVANESGTLYDVSWGYQENANQTQCSGTWSAAGPCANVTDEDWGTAGTITSGNTAYLDFNYSKPDGAGSGSLLQVKWASQLAEGTPTTINYSVDSQCWAQDPLQFQLVISHPLLYSTYWYCWNGTGYTSVGGTTAGNGAYEDAMYWKYDNSSYSEPGDEVNVANMSSAYTSVGEDWVFSCRAYNNEGNSSWVNSSATSIQVGCGDVSTDLTLPGHVSSEGTCFNVVSDDVVIDCAGFNVTYDNANLAATFGVNISGYNNVTVKNCIFTESNSSTVSNYAIYMSSTNYTNISNNTVYVYSAGNDGIYLADSQHNFIEYNRVLNAPDEAISITSTAHNNSIYGNILYADDDAIYNNDGQNNSIYNNNITASDVGVYWSQGDNLNIYGNNITSTTYYGLYVAGAISGGNVSSNNISTDCASCTGFFMSGSVHYIDIHDNTVTTEGSTSNALYFFNDVKHCTVRDNNLTATNPTSSSGVYLLINVNNISFSNNRIHSNYRSITADGNSGNVADITFVNDTLLNLSVTSFYGNRDTRNVTFENVTFNISAVEITSTGINNFSVDWYFKVNVTNASGSAIEDATVNVTNVNGIQDLLEDSAASGLTSWATLRQVVMNATANVSENNRTITVNKSGYTTNTTTLNVTGTQIYNVVLYESAANTQPTITWTLPADNNSTVVDQNYTQNISFSDDNGLYVINCSIYSDAAMTNMVWSYEVNASGNLTYNETSTVYTASWAAGVYYENCTVTDET